MFCRRAWQRLGPLAQRAFKPASTNAAPVRHMSFGVPGGSTNITYFLLCGGGLTAAVVYAYKTVNGDSDRYNDRLADMGTKTKAAEAVAEAIAAPAEPTPVEEAVLVAESVAAPAEAAAPAEEPVAETAAEPVAEALSEQAAAPASEEVVAETAAEPAVTEEAAPPVAVEDTPEAAPIAMEEAPAEAPAAESAESPPDLLTAVKSLASSTVEIAAASVGETSIVNVVRHMEGDGKAPGALESIVGMLEPDVPKGNKEEVAVEAVRAEAVEATDVANEEEPKSTEALAVVTFIKEVADTKDAEAPDAEEVITEKTPLPAAVEEGAAAPPSEDATVGAPVVEEMREVASSMEASPEETATLIEEAAPADKAPDAETSVEEALVEALAEPAAEEAVEAAPAPDEPAPVVDTTQLAAASTGSDLDVLLAAEPELTSEAPLKEAKHCHSCRSVTTSEEEVAPPAAVGEEVQVVVQVASDRAVNETEEATEAVPPVERQPTETMAVR